MSNLNFNPVIVTTPMSQSLKASGNWSSTMPIHVLQVMWLFPASVGDVFTVVDQTGNNVIATGRCEVGGQSQIFIPMLGYVSDLQVTALSSGSLYLALR